GDFQEGRRSFDNGSGSNFGGTQFGGDRGDTGADVEKTLLPERMAAKFSDEEPGDTRGAAAAIVDKVAFGTVAVEMGLGSAAERHFALILTLHSQESEANVGRANGGGEAESLGR